MSEITNLYDILSRIKKPGSNSSDYYFHKTKYDAYTDWKVGDFIIVGVGPVYAGKESESEKIKYSLNNVYKFDSKTYGLIDAVKNVKVLGWDYCKGKDKQSKKDVYFKCFLNVNIFGRGMVLNNGLAGTASNVRVLDDKNWLDVKFRTSPGYVMNVPNYPDCAEEDFAFYYCSEKKGYERLRNLQNWIKCKGFGDISMSFIIKRLNRLREKSALSKEGLGYLNYIEKYKSYLDGR